MDWLLLIAIIIIIGVVCYYIGQFDLFLGCIIHVITLGATLYQRFEKKLYAFEDRFTEKFDAAKRKRFFQICMVLEALIIVMVFALSQDRAALAFGVLAATPTGGVLTFFYNPGDFYIGTTVSTWLLSGISFLLVALVVREIEKVENNKILKMVHIILFTFIAGILCSTVVTYGTNQYLTFVDWAYENFPIYLRILAFGLKLFYYLAGIVLLGITFKAFWDNIKTLGVVLSVEAVFAAIAFLVSTLIQTEVFQHAGVLMSLMQGINYIIFELPKQNTFLCQLVITIIFNLIYSIAMSAISSINDITPEEQARYEEQKRRNRIASDYRFVAEIERKSKIGKMIYQRTEPEEYQKYEALLVEYGGFEALKAAAGDVEKIEEEEKKQKQEERKQKAIAEGREAEILAEEPQIPEDFEQIRKTLLEDRKHRYPWGYLKKLLHMRKGKLCKKLELNLESFDRMEEIVKESKFVALRFSPPESSGMFNNMMMRVMALFGAIMFLIMSLAALTKLPFLQVLSAVIIYAALFCAWFLLFMLITAILPRSSKVPDFVYYIIAGLLGAWFTFMSGEFLVSVSRNSALIWPFLISILPSIAIGLIFVSKPMKKLLPKFKFFRKAEIAFIYWDIPLGENEKKLLDDDKVKNPAKYKQQRVAEALCCCMRRQELEEYLKKKGSRR